MNRKLLNGLLVLAVATGGVGTFTSCKDEDNVNSGILLEQELLKKQLDGLRNVTDAAFKENLQKWLDNWTDELSGASGFSSYAELVAASNTMYDFYKKITNMGPDDQLPDNLKGFAGALYKWMFENYIEKSDWYKEIGQLRTDLDALQAQVDALEFSGIDNSKRASSVSVNNVYSPVFGSVNLPVGLSTTILATYKYESKNGAFEFPAGIADNIGLLAEASPSHDTEVLKVISTLSKNNYKLPAGVEFTAAEDFGNMGGALLLINPTSNNYNSDEYTVELVKSNGDVAMSTADKSLELAAFNDVIYFGGTRDAENSDLYALKANATTSNYGDMEFDLDKSGLKDALKQAIDTKSVSSMAHLGEMILKSVNNKLPAYSVKVTWTEGDDENPTTNSVYSPFDIAATVLHPLSYNTSLSAVIPANKKLPVINPLVDYLTKIQNKIDIKIELDEPTIDDVTIELKVLVQDGFVYAMTEIDGSWQIVGDGFPYDADGIQASDKDLTEFVNAVLGAIGKELNDNVNQQLLDQLRAAFTDINTQIQEQLASQVGDFQDYIEKIKESNKLTYAQKLVDVYNRLAEKANNFLADPDLYLQVLMAYNAGDGAHHMSNDMQMPVKVDSSLGNGIELYTTSYTGDIAVPSYKKYVAITGVVNNGKVETTGLDALNTAAGLNEVYSGHQERLAMKVSGLKGKTIRLTYVSVDYRGMCSMANYYMTVY